MIWSHRSVRSSIVYWACCNEVSRPGVLGRIQNCMNRIGSVTEPFFSKCMSPRPENRITWAAPASRRPLLPSESAWRKWPSTT
ncbi:MAG: hypothetical protein ACRD2W_01170 [Acidimicrobiales bacterium]